MSRLSENFKKFCWLTWQQYTGTRKVKFTLGDLAPLVGCDMGGEKIVRLADIQSKLAEVIGILESSKPDNAFSSYDKFVTSLKNIRATLETSYEDGPFLLERTDVFPFFISADTLEVAMAHIDANAAGGKPVFCPLGAKVFILNDYRKGGGQRSTPIENAQSKIITLQGFAIGLDQIKLGKEGLFHQGPDDGFVWTPALPEQKIG